MNADGLSPDPAVVPESEPEASVEEETPSPEEAPATQEAAPDVSTAPPTTPPPNPGVPTQPVNAVTNPGEVPAFLDDSRIGEALRPPEAESPPAQTAEEG